MRTLNREHRSDEHVGVQVQAGDAIHISVYLCMYTSVKLYICVSSHIGILYVHK